MSKIGNTDLVRLRKFEEINCISANIFAKTEFNNPFGSIKDRVALKMIESAEINGEISIDSRIIEATSGNMGISLAAICNVKGYPCTIIMPENMSEKRRDLILNYGAELILTPKDSGMKGSINKVNELVNKYSNTFYTKQFENTLAIDTHMIHTATEIYYQSDGKVDIILAGIGTGATITGIAKFFKNIDSTIKIIGILPSNYPHKIQGIGAGIKLPLLNINLLDQIIEVSDSEALYEQNKIYEYDGLSVGISSGAVLAGLKKLLVSNNYSNKNIALIFPDGADRYQ